MMAMITMTTKMITNTEMEGIVHSGGSLVAEEEAVRTTAVRMHALLRERRRCVVAPRSIKLVG